MSLDKAIKHGKEKRKTYTEKGEPAKDVSWLCRHGNCPYCQSNKTYKNKKKEEQYDKNQY